MRINPDVGQLLDNRHGVLLETLHDYVVATAPQLATKQSHQVLISLDIEFPNLVSLMDALLEAENTDVLANTTIVSLLIHLERYLSLRGHWHQKRYWLLKLSDKSIPRKIAQVVLNMLGTTYSELGKHVEAIEFYQLAIQESGLSPDDPQLARIYGNLGVAYWSLSQLDQALICTRRVLRVEQSVTHNYETAIALANLSQILRESGDIEGGLLVAHRSLEVALQLGDVALQAQFLSLVATHMIANQMLEKAVPVFEMAIHLLTEIQDYIGLGLAQLNYAILCYAIHQYDHAKQWASEAASFFESYGMAEETQKAQKLLDTLKSS